MCTVSVVPEADGFRLLCNRDEQRQRAAALPPTRHVLDTTCAVYPVDPVGGGTWVGVNDAGLAVALLNRTLIGRATPAVPGLHSRGQIVVRLLATRSLREAIVVGAELDPSMFNPFRLAVVHDQTAATLTSDGTTLTPQSLESFQPFMLTSSSLGDDVVTAPREALFERLVLRNHRAGKERRAFAGQERFHAHKWAASGAVSVVMERPDARTVSRTTVSVSGRGMELCYDALDGSPLRFEHLDAAQ